MAKNIIGASFFFIMLFFFAGSAGAATYDCSCTNGNTTAVNTPDLCDGFCSGQVKSCILRNTDSFSGGNQKLPDPLNGATPEILIGKIINAVLGIVGSLALVMFVYGGFMWMLSAGNKERVQKGKEILTWATVGLVVIFSAYALVMFVFKAFQG
jgi:hypothetical protein